jgi:DNA-binding transcriptional ArsR family regulator
MDVPEQGGASDDVRAIRALAHPLRLKLLDLLRFQGPSTATLLAHHIGESSGATSYHLRLLARYGYVEEAPRRGYRERWWRYRERQVILPAKQAGSVGERRLLAELLSREAYGLDRYLALRSSLPEWDEEAFFRSCALRLTAAEFNLLRRSLMELLDSLRRADAEDAPVDALPIRILVFGFPQILEEP